MTTDSTEPRITLHPHDRWVQARIDGTFLADTSHAIALRERGYPPLQYIPRHDVAWNYEHPVEGKESIASRLAFL